MNKLKINLNRKQTREVQQWIDEQKTTTPFFILGNVWARCGSMHFNPVTVDAILVPEQVGKAVQMLLDGHHAQIKREKKEGK